MQLHILRVQAHGADETLRLCAIDRCDLHHYLIADATYTAPGCVSNKMPHTYWFPEHPVGPGDHIILHTGTGTNQTRTTPAGQIEHHFYWNLSTQVWNNHGDHVTLFKLERWLTQAVGNIAEQCSIEKKTNKAQP
jgi:hypothetical protein